MHQIMLQNITSQDKRRRDIVVQEHLEGAGVCASSEKHFSYIIRGRRHLPNQLNIQVTKFGNCKPDPQKPRHFYITRRYDTKSEKGEFTFSTTGDLYIVVGLEIFYVTIIYSIKVDIANK